MNNKFDIEHRMKSSLTLNEDNTIATVTYQFRGLAEAEAFQALVNSVIRLSKDFFDESDDMDKFCVEHGCSEF